MSFYPLTGHNKFDSSGKDRAVLLPYLCDDRVYKNKTFRVAPTVTPTYVDQQGAAIVVDEAQQYLYTPTITGRLLVTPETSVETAIADIESKSAHVVNFYQNDISAGLGAPNLRPHDALQLIHRDIANRLTVEGHNLNNTFPNDANLSTRVGQLDIHGVPLVRQSTNVYLANMRDYFLLVRGRGVLDTDGKGQVGG